MLVKVAPASPIIIKFRYHTCTGPALERCSNIWDKHKLLIYSSGRKSCQRKLDDSCWVTHIFHKMCRILQWEDVYDDSKSFCVANKFIYQCYWYHGHNGEICNTVRKHLGFYDNRGPAFNTEVLHVVDTYGYFQDIPWNKIYIFRAFGYTDLSYDYLPMFFKDSSLALEQWCISPSATKAKLTNMTDTK